MAPSHPPQPSLRWEILIPLAILAVAGGYALYCLVLAQVSSIVTPPKAETPRADVAQPDDAKPRDFTHYGRKEDPAIGSSPDRAGETTTVPSEHPNTNMAAQQMAALADAMRAQNGMIERVLSTLTGQSQSKQAAAQQPAVASDQRKVSLPAAPRTPIKFLIDNSSASLRQQEKSEITTQKDALLEPAHWIRPLDKTKVLYRTQVLPGRLKNGLNSETANGMALIELTVPIYSKQGARILLDKGTVIIARYQGDVKFGQTRIPLAIEEAQPPDGDIIELKALGGDEEGRAGVTGHVNNHYGKLLLATGINAVLQLGVKSLAGTPGAGQYYQNPAQQAVQEAGQSAANDINSVVRQQLKVPPTIEKDAGDIVSVLLEKNLSFYHNPKIVK